MIKRLWAFAVETDDDHGYLTATGEIVHDKVNAMDWIGTDAEAYTEADRRCDAAETRSSIVINKVIYESQGKVRPWAKTGQAQMPF